MNLPEIFVCARRAPVASAVVSVYFAEFVQASRERAKREAEEFLAAHHSKVQPRTFLAEPVLPTGFGELGRTTK